MMFCSKCHNDIVDCTCPDLEERLRDLQGSPRIFIPTCRQCGKPAPICKCIPQPCEMLKNESRDPCGRLTVNVPPVCDECHKEISEALDRLDLDRQCNALRKAMNN
jgi:hypothetical protein